MIMVTDCPRNGFDRVGAAWLFKKRLKTVRKVQVKWHISGSRGKMKFARNSFGADTGIARSKVSGVPRAGP